MVISVRIVNFGYGGIALQSPPRIINMSPSKDFDFLYLTPSTRNVPDVMAYSELVSLSACKSYSRTPGSMRKYAVCGSMRELGGAGRAGNMEGCAKHAGAGGSMRKYAGVCGKFREVCGSTRIVWGKYAGSMETYTRAYIPHTSPHTYNILPAYFRRLPHTSAYSRQLLHASRAPPYFPHAPPSSPHTTYYAHATAESRTLPHTP